MTICSGRIVTGGTADQLSVGTRIKNWTRREINPGDELLLEFENSLSEVPDHLSVLLRLFVAREHHGRTLLEVDSQYDGGPGVTGAVNFASLFQPVYFCVTDLLAKTQTKRDTVELRLRNAEASTTSVSLFADSSADLFHPALLVVSENDRSLLGAVDRFERSFWSALSLQPFNWHEGCVLDGMHSLARYSSLVPFETAQSTMCGHMKFFWSPTGNLEYVGPLNEMVRDKIIGLETLLPFAALIQSDPDSPNLATFDAFAVAHSDEAGIILDRGSDAEGRRMNDTATTIEGCYTIAYPLALRAMKSASDAVDQEFLVHAAINNVLVRTEALVSGGVVYQRKWDGQRSEQGDWARGIAWFLLGTARTVDTIGIETMKRADTDATDTIVKTVESAISRVLRYQRENGGWRCYINDPSTELDTSGSAGIAAALLIWKRLGFFSAMGVEGAAKKAYTELTRNIAPDGTIKAVAQLNRAGDDFQREAYRVHGQYAMGLFAQLLSEVRKTS